MVTLYVTDLDGTLIRDDLTLSDYSRRELVSMLNDGVPITVATARSIVSLSAILGDIPFRLPVVEFNGAFLTDYRTKKHRVVHAIDPGIVDELYRAIIDAGMLPFISSYDGTRDLLSYREIRNPGENAYLQERLSFADQRLRRVDDLRPALHQKVVCLTLIDREDRLTELADRLSRSIGEKLAYTLYAYRYFPGWHFFSIHDAHATKDQGIRALQKACGLENAELVVFGDDVNDLAMFRIASRALATANALDEVKAAAHETIGSNHEDSVVRWIRTHYDHEQQS